MAVKQNSTVTADEHQGSHIDFKSGFTGQEPFPRALLNIFPREFLFCFGLPQQIRTRKFLFRKPNQFLATGNKIHR
jgi:hypothetical protein